MTDDGCGTSGSTADDDADREYAEWKQRADELDDAAAASIDTGDARLIGQAFTDLAVHLMGLVAEDEVVEYLLIARDAWIDAEQYQDATECLAAAAHLVLQSGNYEDAAIGFETCMEEYREIGEEKWAAEAANNLGSVLSQIGQFSRAEEVLTSAIDFYRRNGMLDDIPEVQVNLGGLYGITGRIADAKRELTTAREHFDRIGQQKNSATASMALAGIHMQNPFRLYLARRETEKAIDIFSALELIDDQRDAEVVLAYCLAMVGEWTRANALYDGARQYYVEVGRPDKAAAVDYNLANMYVALQQFDRADAAFESAAKGLADAGQHHQLSRLEWNRVKRYFTEAAVNSADRAALTRHAVDAALTSLIAADYERFQFVSPRRRADWASSLRDRTAMTFSIVATFGDAALVADLIEWGINGGVYGVPDADAPSDSEPVLENLDDGFGDALRSADVGDAAMTMGAVNLLARPDLPMAPPPALVGVDGTVMLGRYREMAAKIDPDVDRLLATVPSVAAW